MRILPLLVFGPFGPGSTLRAENITFPAAANAVNITSYAGIDLADNANDDTAAIQQAIKDHIHKGKTLYFPNGTYNISAPLEFRRASDNAWDCEITLQGQSEAGVIFKLKANTFTDPAAPQPVIRTASQNGSVTGGGNQAFFNNLRNLTIDTGTGNSGAIGLDHIANNLGTVENVTIKSSDANKVGVAGLSMKRSAAGPLLIRKVTISGFDVGIDVANYEYGQTYEYIALSGQKVAGIRTNNAAIAVRGLTSTNTVPAVAANVGNEAFTLITDATLSGGLSANQAILFKGGFLGRNITTTGYGAAIRNQNNSTNVAGPVAEYRSHATQSEFTSPTTTMNLPVEDAPVYANEDLNDWLVIDDSATDDTANIQAAINTANSQGKRTLVFKAGGHYNLSSTITVSGGIRRIISLGGALRAYGALLTSTDGNYPVFKVENLTGPSLTFERLYCLPFQKSYSGKYFRWIEHATTVPVVIKNSIFAMGYVYRNTVPGGKLFVEDVSAFGWTITDNKAWMRQANPEFYSNPLMTVSGPEARLWILGLKHEGTKTLVRAENGAYAEILGAFLKQVDPNNSSVYAFDIDEANLGVSLTTFGPNSMLYQVREKRGGVTQTRTATESGTNGMPRGGYLLPLYNGFAAPPPVAANYDLLPAADTYVRGSVSFNTQNFGTATSFTVKGTTDLYNCRRSFLRFNLAPYSGTATSAELSLIVTGVQSGVSPTTPALVKVYAVTDDSWIESGTGGMTWNTQPAIGTLVGSVNITGTGEFPVSLTSHVNSVLAGDKVMTISLQQDTTVDRFINFGSREATDTQRPVLTIEGVAGP